MEPVCLFGKHFGTGGYPEVFPGIFASYVLRQKDTMLYVKWLTGNFLYACKQ